MADQGELIRLVAAVDEEGAAATEARIVALAVGRTAPGRGAYLCRGSRECFELARRKKAFARALRRPVDPEALERLASQLF